MPHDKSHTIYNWKQYGLIYDDYDELYDIYIKTMNCGHCNKEFTKSNRRCMDHDHNTGMFRNIVCNRCNIHDSYIKYPNGFTIDDYRHRRRKWEKEKTTCICGDIISKGSKYRHHNSKRHLNKMDKYMENID